MEQIEQVAFRINDPKLLRRHYAPYILRMMNRVYHRLNTRLRCLEKCWELDFSTLDPLVQYMSQPADLIEPYRIEPFRTFMDPQNFVFAGESYAEQTGTFTIDGGKFYFSNIADTDFYKVWYWSSGLTLVDKADGDLGTGEINKPEWPWEGIHDLLFYATCIEVSNDYPMYKQDLRTYEELRSELQKLGYHKQSVTPNIMGGWGRKSDRDDGYGEY